MLHFFLDLEDRIPHNRNYNPNFDYNTYNFLFFYPQGHIINS